MTLRNAIDKDYFYIENIAYSENDFKKMSLDDLETLKMLINKKIDGISISLVGDDFNSSKKRALQINRRVLDYVNFLLRRKRVQQKQITDFFMEAAHTVLPPMLFDQVLEEAQTAMKAYRQ